MAVVVGVAIHHRRRRCLVVLGTTRVVPLLLPLAGPAVLLPTVGVLQYSTAAGHVHPWGLEDQKEEDQEEEEEEGGRQDVDHPHLLTWGGAHLHFQAR